MAVVPVYNMITVPDSNIYIRTDVYQKVTGKNPAEDEKITILVAKENMERREMTGDSFYPIGITGLITEVNPDGYLVARLKRRVNIQEVSVFPNHGIDLAISGRADIEDMDPEEAARRLKDIKAEMLRFSENYQWASMIRGYLARWSTIGEIAGAMSPWMMNSNEERYAVLAEDSVRARFDALEKMIYENLAMTTVQSQAKTAQEEDNQKLYRESAIKKQMEYLQKELDEMHPENVSDIRRLEIKMEESGMNETAKKEGQKILNRLKAEGQHGAETGMLMDYMDFLTSLPWKKETSPGGEVLKPLKAGAGSPDQRSGAEKEEAKTLSLRKAEQVLEEDHFGLEKVKRRILQQIAVMNLKGVQSGSIILFVGAPGTGKTSIGQSIARALGREYVRVSLGGVRDEADIRGHRRTYIGAMPGRIMDGIAKAGVSNPVMVLDEVDKLSVSYNGDPASALLEVLDPEQNSTFTDHYLNVPYDLSDVLFICTANTIETIPEPLLNRMEVIRFGGYTPLEKQQIARRHLLPKAMKAVGIGAEELEVTDEAIETVISDYTREAGVRGLKKQMDSICRSAAVELVERRENNAAPDRIIVTKENLRTYMDSNPLHRKSVPEKAAPGVVTGLAWTSVGGDILYIETLFTKGSGKIQVTGQLGDVMKESAQIAVSLVKSIYPEKAEIFQENDLHIHVPDGATPKDGPSAGITLTTALASLVSGTAVLPSVGMTGEVSLQGGVNPIGGLPEKLMAAQRAGVKKVFIPAENTDDLKEVAQEVKDQLEIIPVTEAREVLEELGLIQPRPVLKAV